MVEWAITNLLTALWVWGAGFGVGNAVCGVRNKTCRKIASPGWMYWAKDKEVKGQIAAWAGLAVFLAVMTTVVTGRQSYAHGLVYTVLGLVAGAGAGAVMIRREIKLGEAEVRQGSEVAGDVAGVVQETVKAGPGDFQSGGVGVGVK